MSGRAPEGDTDTVCGPCALVESGLFSSVSEGCDVGVVLGLTSQCEHFLSHPSFLPLKHTHRQEKTTRSAPQTRIGLSVSWFNQYFPT